MSNIVTFKIEDSDGGPDENMTLVKDGLSGELQPAGTPLAEALRGDSEEDYFDLFSDSYAAGVSKGMFVITLDSLGAQINKYKIVNTEDWGDQLDLKVRLVE